MNQEAFDLMVKHTCQTIILSVMSDLGEDFDPEDGAEYDWFDYVEPDYCDILEAREFIPNEYLWQADADLVSETLLRQPTTDLLWAAKCAGLDAYRALLFDETSKMLRGE